MFQAGCKNSINTSNTNCHADEVDLVDKLLIICSNSPPYHDWIIGNSIELHITEHVSPIWVAEQAALALAEAEQAALPAEPAVVFEFEEA